MVAEHYPSLAPPWEFAKLTDWYIYRVLLHARNDDGSLKIPIETDGTKLKVPKTYLESLADLEGVAAAFGPGNVGGIEEAKKKLREKYDKKKGGNNGPSDAQK